MATTRIVAVLSLLVSNCVGLADPHITAAPVLQARTVGPSIVGYVSSSGAKEFSDLRTCDWGYTFSTSGSYAQCCSTSGACNFYTSCSANTLFAASASVACDVDVALSCNTGLVVPTTGISTGASYLACWQTTLGSGPVTFVQDVPSAAIAVPTTGASTTKSGTSSKSSGTSNSSSSNTSKSSSSPTNSAASSGTSATTPNSAPAASAVWPTFSGIVCVVLFTAFTL